MEMEKQNAASVVVKLILTVTIKIVKGDGSIKLHSTYCPDRSKAKFAQMNRTVPFLYFAVRYLNYPMGADRWKIACFFSSIMIGYIQYIGLLI